MKIAVVQVSVGTEKIANLDNVFRWIDKAAKENVDLIALPESFHIMGNSEVRFENGEFIPGPLSERLSEAAKLHSVWLLAGSFNEKVAGQERMYNTSLLFNPEGEQVAKYSKIHLFDAVINDQLAPLESKHNQPGTEAVLVDTPFCKIGLTICYDLRFPELFRLYALAGAKLVFVPSNFALQTGKDHWEVLLRARAIENGMFVVAPATIHGAGMGGVGSYGRSMVIDPWGTVIACAPDREGVIVSTIDLTEVDKVRKKLPCLSNRQPETYTHKL